MKTHYKFMKGLFTLILNINRRYLKNGNRLKALTPRKTTHGFNCNLLIQSSFNVGYLAFIGLNKKVPKENETETNSDYKLEKDINNYISSAQKAIKDGDLQKAELILSKALEQHEGNHTVGVLSVYDMLATVAFQAGDIEKSKEMLEKVIDYLMTSGVPQDHNQVVSFRLKLARIQSKLGKTDEADINFRMCLEIQKLKYQVGLKDEEAEKLRINCLFWYGKHLIQNKKHQDAKQCFETAYTLSARVDSFENNQIMVILYNLSETMMAIGERDGAVTHILNAIILGRVAQSPDLPLYYTKLGLIYLSKGMLQEARHWCESGQNSAKKRNNKVAQTEGESCIKQINEALKMGPLKI